MTASNQTKRAAANQCDRANQVVNFLHQTFMVEHRLAHTSAHANYSTVTKSWRMVTSLNSLKAPAPPPMPARVMNLSGSGLRRRFHRVWQDARFRSFRCNPTSPRIYSRRSERFPGRAAHLDRSSLCIVGVRRQDGIHVYRNARKR